MLDLFLKNKKLKPVIEKQRHKCPFYGFALGTLGGGSFLIDQDGNQCAVITGRHSPCQMEFNGQMPLWEECYFNNEKSREIIEKMASSLQIFPKEFMPREESSWKGMNFKDWYDYIMKQP